MNRNEYVVFTTLGYHPEYGGVENSVKFLSKEVKSLGFRPIVITAQTSKRRYRKLERIEGALVIRFPFRPFHSSLLNIAFMPVSVLALCFLMRKVAKRLKVRIAINRNQFLSFFSCFFFKPNIYVAPGFSKFQAAPKMLVSNMSLIQSLAARLKESIHNWFDKQALKRSDRVYLFSENMREQAKEVLGSDSHMVESFRITKPGVSGESFSPVEKKLKDRIKLELNLPVDKKIVLSVGRFVSAKGFRFLSEAVRYLDDTYSVVIVGDGPEKTLIEKEFSDYIESGRLILPGASTQTAMYYKASDIFVLSSIYEPLGQTLLEAGASQLPVVSFRENSMVTNATYEVLGDLAIYATDVTAEAIAEKVEELFSLTQAKFDALAKETRNEVLKKYSWGKLAEQLVFE